MYTYMYHVVNATFLVVLLYQYLVLVWYQEADNTSNLALHTNSNTSRLPYHTYQYPRYRYICTTWYSIIPGTGRREESCTGSGDCTSTTVDCGFYFLFDDYSTSQPLANYSYSAEQSITQFLSLHRTTSLTNHFHTSTDSLALYDAFHLPPPSSLDHRSSPHPFYPASKWRWRSRRF